MKKIIDFPVIDLKATGANIRRLREECGFTVRDLQGFFGFEDPAAIYHWQKGKNLPSVDNLCALSKIFGVSMDDIIVLRDAVDADTTKKLIAAMEQIKNDKKFWLFLSAGKERSGESCRFAALTYIG